MQSRLVSYNTKTPCTTSRFQSRSKIHTTGLRRNFRISRAGLTADRTALDITKMEPLGDRILIKPLEKEEKTQGGVLLPSTAADTGRDARFGEVLAIGENVKLSISKGDKVVFNNYSSAKVEVADGEIFFIHDKNVVATLN